MSAWRHIAITGRVRPLGEVLDPRIARETQAEIALADAAPELYAALRGLMDSLTRDKADFGPECDAARSALAKVTP